MHEIRGLCPPQLVQEPAQRAARAVLAGSALLTPSQCHFAKRCGVVRHAEETQHDHAADTHTAHHIHDAKSEKGVLALVYISYVVLFCLFVSYATTHTLPTHYLILSCSLPFLPLAPSVWCWFTAHQALGLRYRHASVTERVGLCRKGLGLLLTLVASSLTPSSYYPTSILSPAGD